jgi:hypothetical protein
MIVRTPQEHLSLDVTDSNAEWIVAEAMAGQGFNGPHAEASRRGHMSIRRLVETPLLLGGLIGFVFGAVNLLFTWFSPVADDSAGVLLRFYGPMFFLWAFASFRAARNNGRLLTGITTGLLVAFATFCVYDSLVQLRINLFLDELTARADWQDLMRRFRASEFESLRVFVNLDYLKSAPLKIGVASAIGAFMGVIGGSAGWLASRRITATA